MPIGEKGGLTDQEAAMIVRLRLGGATYKDICEEVGRGHSTVERVLAACGLTGAPRGRRPGYKRKYKKLTAADRDEIVCMYKCGVGRKQIAKTMRRGWHTIAKGVTQSGVREEDRYDSGTPCPIPQMPAVMPNRKAHLDQIPATCFCVWCDRDLCNNMNAEQHAEVMAAYAKWAEKKLAEYLRHHEQDMKIRRLRTPERAAWAKPGRKG